MRESTITIPREPENPNPKSAGFGAVYLWQCAPSTVQQGKADHFTDGGCWSWQVRQSSIRLIGKKKMQAKCKHCGRRPKLSAPLVEYFLEVERAEHEARVRNQEYYRFPKEVAQRHYDVETSGVVE